MKSIRLKAHMNAAKGYAKLSHAKRLKVGAVLVKDDRIISIGYNGTPSGASNICETRIKDPREPFIELITKPEVVHAEMNVIAFAAKHGVSTDGCSLVITDSPCFECCKLIIQSGIKEVYYEKEYRDKSGLKFLHDNNIFTSGITEINGE